MKHTQVVPAGQDALAFRLSTTGDEIRLRIFGKGSGKPSKPLIVYFHGGLFNCGAVEDAEGIARALADTAVIITVDYPLAPDLHFPNTVEAAYEAVQWSLSHAAELGANASRVMVGGDQAGGNLAAAVAMMMRDRKAVGAGTIAGQILLTPLLDPYQTTISMRAAADCPCRQAWADYLPCAGDAMHPYAAPLHSRRLGGLAPALIITAELDPLRDEAEQYAAKLIAAGVPVQVRRFEAIGGGLASPDHPRFALVTETVTQFVSDSI